MFEACWRNNTKHMLFFASNKSEHGMAHGSGLYLGKRAHKAKQQETGVGSGTRRRREERAEARRRTGAARKNRTFT